jgi:nucleoside-diphosphate-sugar epimerase
VRVLVTGASGMLGRDTARALGDRGHDVTVLQRRPSGLDLREVLGDVADRDVVRRATHGQDAVVHLAAKVDVVGRWADYERVNVGGTRAVVDACRAAGTARLVHVSSPSVAHAGEPLVGAGAGPADPARARGGYARSKALGEQVALGADGPDLAVLAVRPHLVWGPGDTQLVARLVARAAAGRLPVLGSGAALIDTTFVDNAVDALVAAVDRCGSAHGRALVVSNGEPRPVAEIFDRVCLAAGVPGPSRRVPVGVGRLAGAALDLVWAATGRQDTPPLTRFLVEQMTTAHWFDQRHTREVLGWTPKVALDEGFRRLASWYAEDRYPTTVRALA